MQTSKRFRFVEDYEVRHVPDKNGKLKKKVIYIGQWVQVLEDAEIYRKLVWRIRLFSLIAVVGLLPAIGLDHAASRCVYVILPLVAGLFPLVYLLMGLFEIKATALRLEKRRYEEGIVRVKRSGMAVALFSGIGFGAYLLYWLLTFFGVADASGFGFADILLIVGAPVAALASLLVHKMAGSVRTELQDNTEMTQNDAE